MSEYLKELMIYEKLSQLVQALDQSLPFVVQLVQPSVE